MSLVLRTACPPAVYTRNLKISREIGPFTYPFPKPDSVSLTAQYSQQEDWFVFQPTGDISLNIISKHNVYTHHPKTTYIYHNSNSHTNNYRQTLTHVKDTFYNF